MSESESLSEESGIINRVERRPFLGLREGRGGLLVLTALEVLDPLDFLAFVSCTEVTAGARPGDGDAFKASIRDWR